MAVGTYKPTIVDQALKHAAGERKFLDEHRAIYAGTGHDGHKFKDKLCVIRIDNPEFAEKNEEPRQKFLYSDGTWHRFPIADGQPNGWFSTAEYACAALKNAGLEVSEEALLESALYG